MTMIDRIEIPYGRTKQILHIDHEKVAAVLGQAERENAERAVFRQKSKPLKLPLTRAYP